jgi:hypothetical protein
MKASAIKTNKGYIPLILGWPGGRYHSRRLRRSKFAERAEAVAYAQARIDSMNAKIDDWNAITAKRRAI